MQQPDGSIVRRPRWRVGCPCGWTGYRLRPAGRPCPRCALAQVVACWRAGHPPSRAAEQTYLVHIQPAYRHAAHYLGTTTIQPPKRVARHVDGNGSRLLRAAVAAGCRLLLVRTWPAGQAPERSFKQRRSAPSNSRTGRRRGAATGLRRYCPLCNPTAANWRAVPGQWLAEPAPQPAEGVAV